ncbi:unnamed protein product [Urochloa humidicola]
MSSSMALRCMLRQIPGRYLPRVGRAVPAPPPASRPMSTVSQDEVRRVAEMHERFMESMKVKQEASIKEVMKAEKECEEASELMRASMDDFIRAVDNRAKLSHACQAAVVRFTGLFVLSALGIDYYYST